MTIVIGFDPGLASLGYAVARIDAHGDQLLDAGLIQTEKSDKKRKVLDADDNVRRLREISAAVKRVIFGANGEQKPKALCVESMSYPRSSSAAAKMALCWGCIGTFSQLYGLPIIQCSPQEVKKKLCAKKDASKAEVAAVVDRRWNAARYLTNIPKTYQEHPYDAAAVIIASLDSEILSFVRSLAAS